MKKPLALLVLAAVLAMLAYNYATTGKLSLLPARLSESEREVAALERHLEGARQRQAQAQRMAGVGGLDTSREYAEASQEVERLEQAIATLRIKMGK